MVYQKQTHKHKHKHTHTRARLLIFMMIYVLCSLTRRPGYVRVNRRKQAKREIKQSDGTHTNTHICIYMKNMAAVVAMTTDFWRKLCFCWCLRLGASINVLFSFPSHRASSFPINHRVSQICTRIAFVSGSTLNGAHNVVCPPQMLMSASENGSFK